MKKIILLLLVIVLFSCENEGQFNPQENVATLEIGNWDMDERPSVFVVTSFKEKIITEAKCYISNDSIPFINIPLIGWDTRIEDYRGELEVIDYQIILKRAENGLFDNELFDSTGINRGYIIIKYY